MASNPIYFTLPNEQGHWNPAEEEIVDLLKGTEDGVKSRRNFIIFAVLFSVVHAAADAILAYSSAELGTKLGSNGGFIMYVFYTATSFLAAKPLVEWLGAKQTVLVGLLGTLTYIALFFLAMLMPKLAIYVFLLGSAVGGCGAGLLWTGQGTYYANNANEYSVLLDSNLSQVLIQFASIFAGCYLGFETAFKFIATIIFVSTSQAVIAWKPTVFGLYATFATMATVLYSFLVEEFDDHSNIFASDGEPEEHLFIEDLSAHSTHSTHSVSRHGVMEISQPSNYASQGSTIGTICSKSWAVAYSVATVPKLQLLLPYQISYGFTIGLVDTYVNGIIVSEYLGDGYIGLLSGIITLIAAVLAPVLEYYSKKEESGSYFIMMIGAACFSVGGVLLFTLSDKQISFWPIIVLYYMIQGVGRGVWENTNKATISIFFQQDHQRDIAYAAIYFASGLATALGFAFFQFLSKKYIAIINLSASLLALVCFHFGYLLHKRCMLQEALLHVRNIVSTSRSNSDSSLDSLVMNAWEGKSGRRTEENLESSVQSSQQPASSMAN